MKKIVRFFCIFFMIGTIILASIIFIKNYVIDTRAINDIGESSIVKNDEITPRTIVNEDTIVEEIEPQYEMEEIISLDIDLSEFENTPIVGWIRIEDTNVDYPVVQAEDNEYFLHHLYNGEENSAGSIFIDYRNDGFDNRHVILYGHHMRNGTMFHDILNYQDEKWTNDHRYIYIKNMDGSTSVYYVFSCIITDSTGDSDGWSAYRVNFKEENSWTNWLKSSMKKSLISSGEVDVNKSCNVITLSTCMSRGVKTERCVVNAVEISNQRLVEKTK